MKIKFNNRTDTGFLYYSFHKEYKHHTLPATKDDGGYLVEFPVPVGDIAVLKTLWWYHADVVEVLHVQH